MAFEGTVNRFDWGNPHTYIYFQAADATGEPVEWQYAPHLELSSVGCELEVARRFIGP